MSFKITKDDWSTKCGCCGNRLDANWNGRFVSASCMFIRKTKEIVNDSVLAQMGCNIPICPKCAEGIENGSIEMKFEVYHSWKEAGK